MTACPSSPSPRRPRCRRAAAVLTPVAAGLLALSGLAAAPTARAQDLFVAEYFSNTVYRVAPNGSKTVFAQPTVPNGVRLFDLTFAPTGDLFAARLQGGSNSPSDPNNGVLRIDPLGNVSSFAAMSGWMPSDVAFDAASRVYVGSYSDGLIRRYTPTGTPLGVFADAGSDAYKMTFDAAGSLFVTSSIDGRVRRFSATGDDLGTFALVNEARGLAFDAAGDLYVASSATQSIRRFSPTGTDLGVFASVSGMNPYDLAFAPSGELFVSDLGTASTVRRFSAGGGYLGTFSSGIASPSGIAFAVTASAPEPSALALLAPALPLAAVALRRRRGARIRTTRGSGGSGGG